MKKSPRDLLLERFQHVVPKLDQLRAKVLAEEFRPSLPARPHPGLATNLALLGRTAWIELVWSCRRIWAGLAAAWALVFALSFLTTKDLLPAREPVRLSTELRQALQAQNRLRLDLLAPENGLNTPGAEPSRSEPQSRWLPRAGNTRA